MTAHAGLTVVTTTWNAIDLVSRFLVHYQKLGFERVLVMDFDSTDGTREILTSLEWRTFVDLVPFPGIKQLDSSNLLLDIAKRQASNDRWCLFCDPDELLVTPSMRVEDLLHLAATDAEAIVIRRFNMTGRRSIADRDERQLSFVDALTLRIDRRAQRTVAQDISRERLDPPWIFTAIPEKVLVRLETAIFVGDGDHTVSTAHNRSARSSDGFYLLHYPFRTYEAFLRKVQLAQLDFAANTHLPPSYGWQLRRWVDRQRSGQLYEEYLQQFIPDDTVEQLLSDGALSIDESVLQFHRRSA